MQAFKVGAIWPPSGTLVLHDPIFSNWQIFAPSVKFVFQSASIQVCSNFLTSPKF